MKKILLFENVLVTGYEKRLASFCLIVSIFHVSAMLCRKYASPYCIDILLSFVEVGIPIVALYGLFIRNILTVDFLSGIKYSVSMFAGILHLVVMMGIMTNLGGTFPLYWISEFLGEYSEYKFAKICACWCLLLVSLVPIAYIVANMQSSTGHPLIPRTVTRKFFHCVALLAFAPAIVYQPEFSVLALGVGTCFLILSGYLRNYLVDNEFGDIFELFIDVREKSRSFVVAHVFFVFGLSFPLWFSAAILGIAYENCKFPLEASNNSFVNDLAISRNIGWITLGVGDTLGAVIGLCFGRNRWSSYESRSIYALCAHLMSVFGLQVNPGNRTIEGSIGVFIGMNIAVFCISQGWDLTQLVVMELTLFIVTMLEALTSDIDNIVLPVFGTLFFLSLSVVIRSVGTL